MGVLGSTVHVGGARETHHSPLSSSFFHFQVMICFITAHVAKRAKVMFSQVFVILSPEGGGRSEPGNWSQHLPPPPGTWSQHPPPDYAQAGSTHPTGMHSCYRWRKVLFHRGVSFILSTGGGGVSDQKGSPIREYGQCAVGTHPTRMHSCDNWVQGIVSE